jgi:hypothetical protein
MKTRVLFGVSLALPLFLALSGCPLPLVSGLRSDLVITLGRFSPTTTTGVKGAVNGTLSVPVLIGDATGKPVEGSYTVTFTLSGDASLATKGDNTTLGSETVSAGAEQIVDLTVPGAVVAGAYTLFAVLTATDTQDVANNNTAAIDVTLGANAYTLAVTMSLPVATVAPGGELTVGYRVRNTGYASMAAGKSFTVGFTTDLAGGSIGSVTVKLSSPLYPDGIVSGNAALTMHSLADMGFTAATFTGTTGNVTATVTTGGTHTLAVTVPALKPDLTFTSIALPSDAQYVKAGAVMEAAVVVQNHGYAAAPAGYKVKLFVDMDASSTYTTGDVTLYTWASPPAVPFDPTGSHDSITLIIPPGETFPSGVPSAGAYPLGALVTGTVTGEVHTADNVWVSPSTVSFVSKAVDITLEYMSMTTPTIIPTATGGVLPVSLRLYNGGAETLTASFAIHFYASDALVLAPTLDLGTITVTKDIAARKRVLVNASLTVPAAALGFYTVYWDIDPSDSVTELDEGNNTVASANSCFVHFIESDGSGTVAARLIALKPQNANPDTVRLYGELSSISGSVWSAIGSTSGSTTSPGASYFMITDNTMSLVPDTRYGLRFYCTTSTATPYAFRFVPAYVTAVPLAALPNALTTNDFYELNDTAAAAATLDGSANPLFGFVNAYTRYGSSTDYDYFTFSIP